MTLTQKDLLAIKDIVEFSEMKMEQKISTVSEKVDKVADGLTDFREEMSREVSDLAENTREALNQIGGHEVRIKKLELKTGRTSK